MGPGTKRIVITVAAVLVAAAPGASWADPFVTAADLRADSLLPPPPAPGSPRALAEIAELKDIAARRTPADFDAAARDAHDETGAFFAGAIGPGFDFAKLPATARLLSDVHDSEEAVTKDAKTFFHRDRPWIAAPDLKTCTPEKPGPAPTSYPSGHATVGYAMGVVLAALMPAKAQAILARSQSYAESRLVCSVHFRSDIEAGQAFGTALGLKLLQTPAFRAEFDAAAAELSAAHLR